MGKHRSFTDQFKANVALEVLRGDKIVQEIAAKHLLYPNHVILWKRQAVKDMTAMFSDGKRRGPRKAVAKGVKFRNRQHMCARVDREAGGRERFLPKVLKMSARLRSAVIQRAHWKLSISQQCKLVCLSRSAFSYRPFDADTMSMTK